MVFSLKNRFVIKSWHIKNLLDENWVDRISTQQKLHKISPVFPRIEYRFNNYTGILTQTIPLIDASKQPIDGSFIKQLHDAVSIMHDMNFIHGDLLTKNLKFSDSGLRILDYTPSLAELKSGIKTFNSTYPWIDIDDYLDNEITKRTDLLCLKATTLRLSNYHQYLNFRSEQIVKLNTDGVI